MSEQHLIGRREVLKTTASAAGVAAVATVATSGIVGIAHAGTASPERAPEEPVGTGRSDELEAWSTDLTDPQRGSAAHDEATALVAEGLELGTWMVERVYTPRMGALPVVLRTPTGERFQVDILRRDPADANQAMALAARHALFVVNGGNGRTGTEEMQARGTKVLAAHLDAQLRAGVQGPELSSYTERAAAHPGARFGVLYQG